MEVEQKLLSFRCFSLSLDRGCQMSILGDHTPVLSYPDPTLKHVTMDQSS